MHDLFDPTLLSISKLYGLIGYPLSHSFSRKYFTDKFSREQITGCQYELFPIVSIDLLPELLASFPNLQGLNVTIPYKQQVIPFLSSLDEGAAAVGAVNVIKIEGKQLKGYNSDVYGFETSLQSFLHENHAQPEHALILGSGGAAKAVKFVLQKLNIPFSIASRKPQADQIDYEEINVRIEEFPLIINTTPLGMAPNVDDYPDLNYSKMGSRHLLYDLVYNPETTAFMKLGQAKGIPVKNGLDMLFGQAEKAWEIWNTPADLTAKS